MRRSASPSSLKFLAVAAAADTTAMSSRPPQYRPRGSQNQGNGRGKMVTGGSHDMSVRDVKPCLQQGGRSGFPNHIQFQSVPVNPRPYFNSGRPLNQQPHVNQNQHSSPRPRPPSQQNQPIRHSYPYRAQTPKPLDYHQYSSPVPPLHFGIASGDSHNKSVRNANLHLRHGVRGGFSDQFGFEAPPVEPILDFNQYQSFDHRPYFNPDRPLNPTPYVNPNQPFSPRPRFQQNLPTHHQLHPYRPQRPSESIHREWEYARPGPPLHCERFIVLSYNILADYLAINHWDQMYYHIPSHMLDWQWRKRKIIFELGWWSADVMCFQEVDRFHELEDELKLGGYSGIWKMRTGDAVDGCAIFWRASRFKLLHEECIEFNKLGLRNNVAQICVLESLRQNNIGTLPTSSTGSNKVVVCNIHVLYNPKRGEIKLGQIRILLEKAHAVSKIWNNAPIVLCGDFNCTPMSPLYNFLSEQKLDLTGLARDKVSGQASCVIPSPRRFNTNQGALSADISAPPSTVIDGHEIKALQSDSLSDMQRKSAPDVSDRPCTDQQNVTNSTAPSDQGRKEYHQNAQIGYKNETEATIFVPVDHLKESPSSSHCEDGSPLDKIIGVDYKVHSSVASDHMEIASDMMDTEHKEKVNAASYLDNGLSCKHSESNLSQDSHSTRSGVNLEPLNSNVSLFKSFGGNSLPHPDQVSHVDSSENPSSQLVVNDEFSPLPCYQGSVSNASTNIDTILNEKMAKLNEPDEDMKGETNAGEEYNRFLSELHDTEDPFSSSLAKFVRSDFVERDNTKEDGPQGVKALDEISPEMDFVPVDVYKTSYDRSSWTPMEIEIATGDANCALLEHPLKLKSAYTEVEDLSHTRDMNGEPEVTSYNSCFLGTVDYIWRSEGLHTVRALAPMPKHAMQWTKGFPTKKWGSDHIALASELAFESMQTQ